LEFAANNSDNVNITVYSRMAELIRHDDPVLGRFQSHIIVLN
jgi:hypothetical protein